VCLDVELWWIGWLRAIVDFFFSHSGTDTKCRTIDDDDPLEACGPYLSREMVYFQPFQSTRETDSIIKGLHDVMRSALSLHCSANLLSHLCRTWFRECQEVPHGNFGVMMLPSLMVRSMMLES
jgi:hypothetical protein